MSSFYRKVSDPVLADLALTFTALSVYDLYPPKLGDLFTGRVFAQDAERAVKFAPYPRKKIARLSELKVDEPVDFEYPDEGQYAESILVKLGQEAGGGLGPDKDVVAFNYTCTHQGGPLQGTYQAADKALGPCPLHLTTFDLTRTATYG